MVQLLQLHRQKFPETTTIIQEGLDKISEYTSRLEMVPAYTLAMGKSSLTIFSFSPLN